MVDNTSQGDSPVVFELVRWLQLFCYSNDSSSGLLWQRSPAIFVDARRKIPLLSAVDLIVSRVTGLEVLYPVVRLVFIDVVNLNGVFIVVPSPD